VLPEDGRQRTEDRNRRIRNNGVVVGMGELLGRGKGKGDWGGGQMVVRPTCATRCFFLDVIPHLSVDSLE